MFFAREERPRLNEHNNPPSRVVTRQPNLLTRVPDMRPEELTDKARINTLPSFVAKAILSLVVGSIECLTCK